MTTYADANRVALSYEVESTWGTDPDSTSQKINFTGESLKGETGTTRSATIRDDRQTPDIIRTMIRGNGDVNVEWQVDAFDDLLEGLLMADTGFSSETTVIAASSLVAFNNSAGTIVLSSGSWTETPTAGEWIVVQGSTSNDQFYRVGIANATTITPNVGTLTDEAEGQSVTIKELTSDVQGTTQKSFYIRKSFLDLDADGAVAAGYPGMMVDSWTLNWAADQVTTASFSFLGQKEESLVAGPHGGFTAASTDPILNGIDHIKRVQIAAYEFDVVGGTITVKNNLRERLKVGTLGAFSIGMGTFEVSGSLQIFMEGTNAIAAINASQNWSDPALYIAMQDGSAATDSGMVLEIPNIKIPTPTRFASGINSDVVVELPFEAFIGASGNANTLKICKGSAS